MQARAANFLMGFRAKAETLQDLYDDMKKEMHEPSLFLAYLLAQDITAETGPECKNG